MGEIDLIEQSEMDERYRKIKLKEGDRDRIQLINHLKNAGYDIEIIVSDTTDYVNLKKE